MKSLFFSVFFIFPLFGLSNGKENQPDDTKFGQAYSIWKSDPLKALAITDSLLIEKRVIGIYSWKIWDLQSKIYLQLRNTSKSIELAHKADSCYKLLYHKPLSEAHRILAISYKDKGNLPLALYHYQIAADNAVDTLSHINILFNMAELEFVAGDTLNADNHLESNIQYIRFLKNSGYKGVFYMQYANYFAGRHKHSGKILSYYLHAANILEKIKDFERAGFSAVGVAKEYQYLNRSDSCRWWFDKALYLQKLSGKPLGLADIYSNLANYEFLNSNYNQALQLYLQALPYAQQANYLPILENVLKQLSSSYEKTGDYQSSMFFLKKYNQFMDSIGKQNLQAQLSELQTQYNAKRKDGQLNIPQTRFAVFQLFPLYLLLLLCLVSGTGMVWILVLWKKRKNRKENLLCLETECLKTKIQTEEKLKLWDDLQRVLEYDKLYRDPNMSLSNLAQHLKTNRSTLSEVINSYGNKSFTHLINHYRIREACELIGDPSVSHLTIEGVGINTGFKSRSAFYAAFTTEIGETPSAFRKRKQRN